MTLEANTMNTKQNLDNNEKALRMDSVTNSLLDDLKEPLDKVQRTWIRRPAVIITCVIWLPLAMIAGVVDFTRRIVSDCW